MAKIFQKSKKSLFFIGHIFSVSEISQNKETWRNQLICSLKQVSTLAHWNYSRPRYEFFSTLEKVRSNKDLCHRRSRGQKFRALYTINWKIIGHTLPIPYADKNAKKYSPTNSSIQFVFWIYELLMNIWRASNNSSVRNLYIYATLLKKRQLLIINISFRKA